MADLKISQLTSATTPLAGTEVLPVVQSSSTKKVSVANLTAGRAVSVGSLASSGSVQIGSGGPYATGTVYADANWGMLFTSATNGPANSDFGWLNYAGATLAKINSNNFVLESGNFVPATAAKGVNFTANTPAAGMTSQLLNWYEEGAWTPSVTSSSGTITSVTGNVGRYTRVGRSITCVFNFTISNNGTGAGALFVTGLPFVGSQAVLTYYAAFGWNRTTGMSMAGEYNPGTGGTGRIALYKYDATYPVATGDACECIVTYEV